MKFTTALFAVAALTGVTNAAVQFTNSVFNNVTAGKPFTLTWANATGPVTIKLKNGPELALQDVSPVGSGLSGGSFTYQVPSTLPADTYAFEINDSVGPPNYSLRFQLIGGAPASSSSSSSATATATGSQSSSASGTASPTPANNATVTRGPSSTRSTSATPSSSQTRAPSSGVALTSNFALIFLFAGALLTLN